MIINQKFLIIRKTLYSFLAFFDRLFNRRTQLVILCYHAISKDKWRFSVDPDMFKKQILKISQTHKPITLKEVYRLIRSGQAPKQSTFAITFDDGYEDILTVKNFLEKMKIKPTLFLLSDPAIANYQELTTHRLFLKPSQIKSLISVGWEIGCHSKTHANFWSLSSAGIKAEVVEAKNQLEKSFAKKVKYFAYPKGRYTEAVKRAVGQAGYTLAFSMDDSFLAVDTDALALPRVGVDRSHGLREFGWIYSPSSIVLRSWFKAILSLINTPRPVWFQPKLLLRLSPNK